ncbi:MAG TPA: flagellar biosynthesis anti-sigma factor FlgM [Stenotrophomonas sp.]|jgi:negative regulator of flagellin synthesis FlgM
MTQKIEGSLPPAATVRTAAASSKIASAGADRSSPVAAPEASDSLRLTGEAAGLQTLQREMSSAPAIDQGRVQAVRESLQNGSYRINPEAIADRMIQLDQQLAG